MRFDLKTSWRRMLLATSAAVLGLGLAAPAMAGGTLRIAMTASDVPTTTGMPNNGYEGMRFLGYPIFEGLVLWDLSSADTLADIRPGLAESWKAVDPTTWEFKLRRNVKFFDGSPFTVDDVLATVVDFGGAVSAEHGVGQAKTTAVVDDRGPDAIAAMRAIKRAWDPHDVMNPGVLFTVVD